jgi:hypothetical protein
VTIIPTKPGCAGEPRAGASRKDTDQPENVALTKLIKKPVCRLGTEVHSEGGPLTPIS